MTTAFIKPKNWEIFQHYKGRRPPWIKLHLRLLDDYDFSCLPVASKALAPLLWLLAAEDEKGAIYGPSERIAFRLRMGKADFEEAVLPLIRGGFFVESGEMVEQSVESSASKLPRAPGILKPKKKAKEGAPEWFEEFRQIYPKRAGDQGWTKALKAANARLREGHTVEEFLEGARNYAIYCRGTGKVGTEYVKQAATFLGPDKPFLVPHSLPKTKAEVQQDENIAAANAWLATQDLGESEEVVQ